VHPVCPKTDGMNMLLGRKGNEQSSALIIPVDLFNEAI
jgi:hypothetical protein